MRFRICDCEISSLSFPVKLGLVMANKRTGFTNGAKNDDATAQSSGNHNDYMEKHKGCNCPIKNTEEGIKPNLELNSLV